jgi:putative endonuclease
MTNIGKLGEELVAQWLREKGVEILHQRWRWRQGEMDLIAIEDNTLLFIEVKTRRAGNWDADGLLAITPRKQAKLAQTAELFLARYPHLAELACRFDVAIVQYQSGTPSNLLDSLDTMTDLDRGDRLLLIDYLPGAFEI